MSGEQLDFEFEGDLGRRPRPMGWIRRPNLFLIFQADKQVSLRATAVGKRFMNREQITGKGPSEATLHVTLLSFGHHATLPVEFIEVIKAMLSGMRFEPLEIVFDAIMSFANRREKPLVLCSSQPNPPLSELQKRLAKTLRLGRQPFTPHMTLAWNDTMIERQPLDAPIRWTVERPALVFSHVGLSRHERLWPEVKRGA